MEDKIDELISIMTVEEKVGQMIQITAFNFLELNNSENHHLIPHNSNYSIDTIKLSKLFSEYHIGSILQGDYATPGEWCSYITRLQEFNMKYSRLKIPFIFGSDIIHGSSVIIGGTYFPHNPNLAATFNKELNYRVAEITAIETAKLGMHWIFNPELDLGHNLEWGRVMETYGEDPYLCAVMGSIYTKALQENNKTLPYKQAGCARHYVGYSDPRSGRDRTPAEIGDQKLYEFFIPSFRAAIDSGLMSVMINSGEVNGEPVHISKKLLTNILRDDLGFKGVALSDWYDISRTVEMHKAVPDEKESAYLSVTAGLDVYMSSLKSTEFCDDLLELVKEGRITEERIDLSVRRVLRMKYKLGLFSNPFPDCDGNYSIGTDEHRQVALDAARESIVLMKNENNFLPLKNPGSITLAGPFINLRHPLCGSWTLTWEGDDESIFPQDMLTIWLAMHKEFPHSKIDSASMNSMTQKTAQTDAIILAIGEHAYPEYLADVPENTLSSDQQKLIETALNTGKPVVLLLITGRPKVIPHEIYSRCKSVLYVGNPGKEGAQAIAEIIHGKVNPSGKMVLSYPYHSTFHLPYNHKPSQIYSKPTFEDVQMIPYLFEFGKGLSYNRYTYSNLTVSDTLISNNESITASVDVKNRGSYFGKEAVLWFITDEYGRITRPVKQLRYFEKAGFQSGDSKTFTFTILPERDLSYPDHNGKMILEPGSFIIDVGGLQRRFILK